MAAMGEISDMGDMGDLGDMGEVCDICDVEDMDDKDDMGWFGLLWVDLDWSWLILVEILTIVKTHRPVDKHRISPTYRDCIKPQKQKMHHMRHKTQNLFEFQKLDGVGPIDNRPSTD